jgi:hypothetical protein
MDIRSLLVVDVSSGLLSPVQVHSAFAVHSLAMVLNTLAIDPRRAWKGPWRWFHEQMLDCCLPISRVAEEGIVLQQVCSSCPGNPFASITSAG